MSLMDVVHAVNNSNLILPAGDVRIGTRTTTSMPTARYLPPKRSTTCRSNR